MHLLTLVLPALFGVAAAKYVEGQNVDYNNYDVSQRQKLVFQLFNHITDAVMYPEIKDVAKQFNFQQYESKFSQPNVVKNFLHVFKAGLYPKSKYFFMYDKHQYYEMFSMYQVLYYAKDFDSFYRVACFMRYFANEMMFMRAFSMVLRQREDCYNLYVPMPYEVYPYFFAYSSAIESVQAMKYKNGFLDSSLMEAYGIKQMDKNSFAVMEKPYYFMSSPQDKFRYFSDDIDLNAYYAFFHYDFPSFAGDQIISSRLQRRGEYYFFFHQQLLARYYQEALIYGVCEIPEMNYQSPIKYGYSPQMQAHQGFVFPSRSAFYSFSGEFNYNDISFVEAFENMMYQAVFSGFYYKPDGHSINLRNSKGLEEFGRFFYEFLNDNYPYSYVDMAFKQYFYPSSNNSSYFAFDPENVLRDPLSFMYFKHFVSFYNVYKSFMPKYSHEEISFSGVNIENVSADKFVTYFDYYDMDASNAFYLNNEEFNSNSESMQAFIRKRRLNHKPFSFNFDIMSDKAADSIIRVFMGPKYDCMGNEYQFSNNYFNFVEIDAFLFKLNVGKNNVVRNSFDFNTKPSDCFSSSEFFKNVANSKDLPFNDDQKQKCMMGFPDRLLFPKGSKGGFEMRFFFIVSPVSGFQNADYKCDKFRSTYCYDNRAFGFPFDRYFEDSFLSSNMFYKDFFIYHEDSEIQKNVVGGYSKHKSFYNN